MRQAVFPPSLAAAVAATGFTPAVRAGDFLFLTGATGADASGLMPRLAETQSRNALEKAMIVLAQAGAGETDVVELTSYHIDIDTHFDTIQAVISETFTAPLPAWTAVGVAALRRPGALVEFRIVAHCPPGGASAS